MFTLDNPVFATYLTAAALMVLKLMLQGWITVARMLTTDAGLINPEDLKPGPANRNPRPDQLAPNDSVERSRRIQRNDLENIPAFLIAGLLFVATSPGLMLAQVLMYAFVITRIAHTIAYSTSQRHEVRAVFFTVGSLIVVAMAVVVLIAAIPHLGQHLG